MKQPEHYTLDKISDLAYIPEDKLERVCAMLPAAILLQKQAVDDVLETMPPYSRSISKLEVSLVYVDDGSDEIHVNIDGRRAYWDAAL